MTAATEAVRAWIVRTLAGVEGFGRVHAHERGAARPAELAALYLPRGGGALAGGFVRRAARADSRVGGARLWRVASLWHVRAFRAFADADDAAASERLFDAALDGAAAAFRGAIRAAERDGLLLRARPPARASASDRPPAPSGAAADRAPDGLRLDDSGPETFAGVLCHAARLSLTTIHLEKEEDQ